MIIEERVTIQQLHVFTACSWSGDEQLQERQEDEENSDA